MIDMELGPIRPPSEAESLMLRVTRGCHWNKCYFCDLYKKYKFSRRRFEEIEEDLKKAADSEYAQNYTTCFLQDGDAFVLRTEFLMQILEGIHKYLPNIKHVTTYARADSIARKSVSELRELKTAGIEHLYCGMETGSDLILRKINKGFDAATIIISGTKAKEAGMVLSEFTLFGIGGKELAEENAVETAKVLNVIKPDFVRVHATGIKLSSEMWNYVKNKELTLQSEEEIVSEQKIMLGAKISYEVCNELREKQDNAPCHLIVSGSRAPHIPEPEPLHHLQDVDFIEAMKRYSGMSKEFLENRDLLNLFLPIFRADFILDETYCFTKYEKFDFPITALYGDQDQDSEIDTVEAWSEYTNTSFNKKVFHGEHFFIKTSEKEVLAYIKDIVSRYV